MDQKEITGKVPALDEMGNPLNFGWARSPNFIYDPRLINAPRRIVSESERYIFFSNSHFIILEVMDNGYLGYIGMSVISMKDKKRSTQSWTFPFSLGNFELPADSDTGQIKIHKKKYSLNFAVLEEGMRLLKIDIPRYGRYRSLRGELVLTPPPAAQKRTSTLGLTLRFHS